MNSGELRIPYVSRPGLSDREILWFVLAISCNMKLLNFTNHKFPVMQTGMGYGIRSSPEFTVKIHFGSPDIDKIWVCFNKKFFGS